VVGIALTRLLAESFGRALAIMRSNQTVASGAAVPVPLVRATSVGIGAVLIALGGIYAGTTIGYVTPDSTGVNISLVLVVLVVAGGTRSIVGPSIAAIVYVFINAQLSDSPGIEPLVFGGSLIVFLVLPRLPWKDYGRTLSQEWHKLRKRGPNVDPERAEQ